MVSLEDTELSCAAGLSQWVGRESWGCLWVSFSLSLHKYDGLLKVPVLSVNCCPAVQPPKVGLTVSSAWVFCFLGDPGRLVETVSSEVAAWQLPYFLCCGSCLVGTLPGFSWSDQLSFLFCNGEVKPEITTMRKQGLKGGLKYIFLPLQWACFILTIQMLNYFLNLGTFAKSHYTHLNRYVELILLPLWWESGHGSLAWCIWLKCHLREPNFEHYLYLQQVSEVFLTAHRETSINWNIPTLLSKYEACYLWWSYPISGLCKIPRILCNLSMATLCWKLDKPATIQIYKTDVKANGQWWMHFNKKIWQSCLIFLS